MGTLVDFAPFPSTSSAEEMKRVGAILDKQAASRVKPVSKTLPVPPEVLGALVDWVLFDRRVVVRGPMPIARADGWEGDFFPVSSSAVTVDEEEGVVIRSDLHLLAPPMCSISISILVGALGPEGLQDGRPNHYWPTIVGADADRILMQRERFPAAKLYMYTAKRDHPTIDVLPPRVHPPRHARLGREAAVLSRKDEYGVGILLLRATQPWGNPPMEAVVAVFSSSTHTWEDLNFELPGVDWVATADAAVPYLDCICWVFFQRRTMLICDILKENPRIVKMSLPPTAQGNNGNHWIYRSVAVSDQALKFIEVDYAARPPCISIWSLELKGYEWRLQGRLQIPNCTRARAPVYPLPCGTNPDLMYMMTPQIQAPNTFYHLFAVNWRNANLVSSYKFERDRWGILPLNEMETPYIGSHIASFVSHPPIAPAEDEHGLPDEHYQIAAVDIAPDIEQGLHKFKTTKRD